MARLERRSSGNRWRVSVRGALGAGDLRRLERACAPALERNPVPLELDVGALSGVDEAARRFVHCLLRRGASLVGPDATHWSQVFTGPTAS